MIFGRAWFAIAAFTGAASAQVAQETIDLGKEPHHTILVQNSRTRVYRLRLAPGESTLRHEHTGFYAFVSLYDTTIQNEVLGRNPVVSQLAAGELHTSKGGFRLIEHNVSTEPADIIVIERVGSPTTPFASPIAEFPLHSAAVAKLFEQPFMRAYSMRMAAGGRVDPHDENYPRLLIALTDLRLRDEGGATLELSMKQGDVRYLEPEMKDTLTNIGTSACELIVIEFD